MAKKISKLTRLQEGIEAFKETAKDVDIDIVEYKKLFKKNGKLHVEFSYRDKSNKVVSKTQRVDRHLTCTKEARLKRQMKRAKKRNDAHFTTEDLKEAICKIYGKEAYDLSKTVYTNAKTKFEVTCRKHNESFGRVKHDMLANKKGCPLCKKEKTFIKRAKLVHGDKYSYNNIHFKSSVPSQQLVLIYCKKCKEYFPQKPSHHISGHGCPTCGYKAMREKQSLSTEDFIRLSREVHGDKYDYSITKYKNYTSPINFICPIHGVRVAIASDHLQGHRCSLCSAGTSYGELKISEWLDKNGINNKEQVRFKDCKDIRPLPFDFALYNENNELLLLIEYDGEYHYKPIDRHSNYQKAYLNFLDRIKKDNIKTKYCEENNISLLRIPYWRFDEIEYILENELIAREVL